MNYVEYFKNKLECCISQKTAELIKLNNELIVNKKLENDINLLNLFTIVISDLDCNEEIPSNIRVAISSICGSSTCFNCDSNNSEIIIEEWDEDISQYETMWVAQYECCESDEDYIWVPLAECCESQPFVWIPFYECCEKDESEIEI